MTEPHPFRAAFLIIGNEILSGRTTEKNLPVLAHLLAARGWQLGEARVVADIGEEIITALNALRQRHALVFTSGGIGPTHDDITTESIAAALGREVVEHEDALAIMADFYRARDLPFTDSRRRMARTPAGAEVIRGEFPGAPAYQVDNVIVCAGVPAIFNMMATAATATLPAGVIRSATALRVHCGESVFADALAAVSAEFPAVEIGSYPREENGAYVCQIVFTASDIPLRDEAKTRFCDYLQKEGLDFEALK